jgi:hypothetical protein
MTNPHKCLPRYFGVTAAPNQKKKKNIRRKARRTGNKNKDSTGNLLSGGLRVTLPH